MCLLATVASITACLWPTRPVSGAGVARPVAPPSLSISTPASNAQRELIWPVEHRDSSDVYSNGLQTRDDYLRDSEPRHFRVYTLDATGRFNGSADRHLPAGIVFHTTESLLLPFEASRNAGLVRTREDLLAHIRNQRLYNFLIDRFGQVFRVIPEDQIAFHAGHSVWADESGVYVDLNESFIGVSFEARSGEEFRPTPAQIRAGRLLTEMLRSVYRFPESNCVTHAQVSVNPENMRIGFHTDWGASFPFSELGISPGYASPLPSIQFFGFSYDDAFLKAIGGAPWAGLRAAELQLLQDAASRHMSVAAYRVSLQSQYRHLRGPFE